uniref:Sodium-dependent phosphate transporter n=2 Tax=Acrobeloides nanus TaxID=290746 RepID=A0A914DIV8_9BILA
MEPNIKIVEINKNEWHVTDEDLCNNSEKVWKKLTSKEKAMRVLKLSSIIVFILLMIFAFICSLSLMADSLKLIGGRGIGSVIKSSNIIKNPVSASMVGMLITVVLQSSSTLTSVLVGMIAGGLITVHQAIPIMLGAEIGGSLSNVLISLTLSDNRDQFRRAFAAVTLSDVFNFLSYFIFLPLEMAFGLIEKTSGLLVLPFSRFKSEDIITLNLITDPIVHYIIQVNDDAINNLAISTINLSNYTNIDDTATFIFRCVNLTTHQHFSNCHHFHIFMYSTWSDLTIGIILFIASLITFTLFMFGIVKLMKELFAGNEIWMRKLVSKNFPKPFGFLTDYFLIIIGCVIVMIMRSSGVFRTVLTPLVGIGVVSLEKLYPLTIGGHIGTTFTSILAALTADPAKINETLQMALAQTIFNVFGALLFFPIPFMRTIPIHMATKLGNVVAKYRWFALVYILMVFVVVPSIMLNYHVVVDVFKKNQKRK